MRDQIPHTKRPATTINRIASDSHVRVRDAFLAHHHSTEETARRRSAYYRSLQSEAP